jgi:hypothetical protein
MVFSNPHDYDPEHLCAIFREVAPNISNFTDSIYDLKTEAYLGDNIYKMIVTSKQNKNNQTTVMVIFQYYITIDIHSNNVWKAFQNWTNNILTQYTDTIELYNKEHNDELEGIFNEDINLLKIKHN